MAAACKSWKREVAGASLVLWAAVTSRLFFMTSDPVLVEALGAHYGAFSLSVWTFAGTAFVGHAWLNRGAPK